MYKCEFCKTLIQKNIKSHKVIVEVIRKSYPVRIKAFKHNGKYVDDPGGTGYEVVKEKTSCIECKHRHLK